MDWRMDGNGNLVYDAGKFTIVVSKHKIDANIICGYDVQSFLKDNNMSLHYEFMGSLHDSDEFFDYFTYMTETVCEKPLLTL
jgi:hypothetical protein